MTVDEEIKTLKSEIDDLKVELAKNKDREKFALLKEKMDRLKELTR